MLARRRGSTHPAFETAFRRTLSIPGGKIRLGERAPEAALRELYEETGVKAELIGLIDVVDAIGPERHFILIDYAAQWISGEPVPGGDAAEAEFVTREAARKRLEWDQTRRVLDAAWSLYSNTHRQA